MCLLIVASRLFPEAPLIVGANRDELLARPAVAMTVLREQAPRILGGRDLLAGGTWLAVNEAGVFAALTNQPSANGRDSARRSRGELPMLLASHTDAAAAAEAFARAVRPADYNPAWILVGDRASLFYIALEGAAARATERPPGLHVLENRPLGAPSPKVDWVEAQLHGCSSADAFEAKLREVLPSHVIPPGAGQELRGTGFQRPPQTEAACVHAGPYGTRSAAIVSISSDPAARPRVLFSDGPSCTAALQSADALWGQ